MVGEDRTVEIHGLNCKENESKRSKMPQRTMVNRGGKEIIVLV